MGERQFQRPDCKVRMGSSEYLKVIPACIGGSALVGCARMDLCAPNRVPGETAVPVPGTRINNVATLAESGWSENLFVDNTKSRKT